MNTTLRRAMVLAAVLLGGIFVVGCVQDAKLEVMPASITFGEEQSERRLTISNTGSWPFEWRLETVSRTSEEADWVPAAIEWLSADKMTGVLAGHGLENLNLIVDRSRMQPGTYTNYAAMIVAGKTQVIIPVSLLVEPLLRATPAVISLQENSTSALFQLENRGQTALTWRAKFFPGSDPTVPSQDLPADIVLQPDGGTLVRQSSIPVRVSWTQQREDFGLRLSSPEAPGHDAVVLFRFADPLTDLQVDPKTLTVYLSRSSRSLDAAAPEQPASKLTLTNVSGQSLQWSVAVRTLGAAIEQAPSVLSVEASTGNLPAGQEDVVAVRVNSPEEVLSGSGNYELLIQVQGQESVIVVPVIIEAVSLPVVIASDPPNPDALRPEYTFLRTLDFGRTETQRELWVTNIGPLDSLLFFRIVHEDQNSSSPLIVSVQPDRGDTNRRPGNVFYIPGTNDLVDAKRVIVTIDRSVMQEDVEYRKLYIEAWNQDGTARIDAVEPWEVELRVERPPMKVEGALNRSRPPFLMRFVFLLRDTVGRAIPTRTAEERERIRFEVSEDSIPLDLNEVTLRVDGPETLKGNVVVMLDYTGSLYRAGTDASENPRLPGEVIDEVRDAVAMFLDDLPAGYRVALMYHNDRQAVNRLIHPFTTDRSSLKRALRNFNVPPQLHGTSDIWDALSDAVTRIVAEDPADTLPFDEADVRAVFFITDGNDNSSTVDASSIATEARDNHVRLYPLVYNVGAPVNYADVITLAEESGGHLYNAGNPENLVYLLGHKRSLVLSPVDQANSGNVNTASFRIRNAGREPLSWSIFPEESYPWIASVTPASGTVVPGGESLVTVTVAPNALTTPLRVGRALFNIATSDGDGEVVVFLALDDGSASVQQLSLGLYDEPGEVWSELRNQIVLSYVTPLQRAAQYNIRAHYTQPTGGEITGFFEEDSIFYMGDVRAGQISLRTTGILVDTAAATLADVAKAEVYVRADYVPRKVSSFKLRFMPMLDADIPESLMEAFDQHTMKVELAPAGILVYPGGERPNWRLVPGNDGIYTLLTPEQFSLPYAASGNLLRITFANLLPFVQAAAAAGLEPEFFLDMRADNDIYYAPQTQFRPSQTVYFLYPSGPVNPDRPLRIGPDSDLAAPSRTIVGLVSTGINPEAPGAWDRDDDGIPDFNDPYPDDEYLPGKLLQPESLRFDYPGIDTRTIALVNNRWDTITIRSISIETPELSPLSSGQFVWYAENGGGWTVIEPSSLTGVSVGPGETVPLQLRFEPLTLSAGAYTASIRLQTDLYDDEITAVEVRL